MNNIITQKKTRAVWIPNPGSQYLFLAAKWVDDLLLTGTRGPGKTTGLLMDFAQDVGKGYGKYWQGILFRRTYRELNELVVKAELLFPKIFNRVRFNHTAFTWNFPDGECLRFRYMRRPADYWSYHGHEYPWIGWEELTTHPTPECFEAMMACNRVAVRGVPKRVRANCNPWGVGHNWVKQRYIQRGKPGEPVYSITADPITGKSIKLTSMWLHGHIKENRHLIEASPEYYAKIINLKDGPKKQAWAYGDWDINAGGYFADYWRDSHNVIERFRPPSNWVCFPAFDWGSSRPFSLGLWAVSDGTTAPNGVQYKQGTMIRFDEWYGCQLDRRGEPIANEGLKMRAELVGAGINKRLSFYERQGITFQPGPADPSIWTQDGGDSINAMLCRGAGRNELFVAADNTRKTGWEKMAELMDYEQDGGPRLLVMDNCENGFIRTVPILERSEKDPDDINTDSEDHVADETRYAVNSPLRQTVVVPISGF